MGTNRAAGRKMSGADDQWLKFGLTRQYKSKLPKGSKNTRQPCQWQWSQLMECFATHKWDQVKCAKDLAAYTMCVEAATQKQQKLKSLNFHLRKVVKFRRK